MNTIWITVTIFSIFGLLFGSILGYASLYFLVETDPIIQKIDELLPQSQCGQCGYPGCRPYAEAIYTKMEKINRCSPGGDVVMLKIATLLNIDPQPINGGREKIKPTRMLAFINETNCIGCTKCTHICPVDAIIGAPRVLHTVIADFCTGCNLCVTLCPTQCIELQPAKEVSNNWKWLDLKTIPVRIVPSK